MGFKALPPPSSLEPWTVVLELTLDAKADDVEEAFRRLSKQRHPDMPGGSEDAMAALTRARREALAEVGVPRLA